MLMQILGILVLLAIVAVLIWCGDRLLALAPQSKLIQVGRILVIGAVSIWVICLIAELFGIPTPFWPGYVHRHRG